MTEKRRSILTLILSCAGGLILFLLGLLANHDYDYVKRVDAKCIALEIKKADKDDFERMYRDMTEFRTEMREEFKAQRNMMESHINATGMGHVIQKRNFH